MNLGLKIPQTLTALVLGASLLTTTGLADQTGKTEKHSVEKTELIADFARDKGLAAEHIAWANGTNPNIKVEEGRKLWIPARLLPDKPPENGAYVNLAERGFYVYREGQFKGFFPISVGSNKKKDYRTPIGTFKLLSRVENPTWTAPDSDWAEAMKKDRIDAESEDNPLGEYWFGIDAPTGGYGFHENTAPAYTGDTVSHGCMRLYPEHAKTLYNSKLLMPGDTVKIVNEPVRLSKGKNESLMVAVYPAIYGASLEKSLDQALEKRHIVGLLSEDSKKKLLKLKDGIPRPIVNQSVEVSRGSAAWTSESEPILVDGQVMIPTAFARDLGLSVNYDGKAKSINIGKGEKSKTFSLNPKAKGDHAARWGDATYVKASQLLKTFAIPYNWKGEDKTLEIAEVTS